MKKERYAWHYLEVDGPLSYVFGRQQGEEIVDKVAIISLVSSSDFKAWHWVVMAGEHDWREGDEPTKAAAMDKAIDTLNRVMPRNKETMNEDMAKIRLMLDNRRDTSFPDHRSYSEILKGILKDYTSCQEKLTKIERVILKE